MAKKRMFSTDVVETDHFYSLGSEAQMLYLHLNMYGDDDGVVASPRRLLQMCGASLKAYQELEREGYISTLPSGVCALLHWRLNNTLRNDRYKRSVYHDELCAERILRV